jgi:hypothetical protein
MMGELKVTTGIFISSRTASRALYNAIDQTDGDWQGERLKIRVGGGY